LDKTDGAAERSGDDGGRGAAAEVARDEGEGGVAPESAVVSGSGAGPVNVDVFVEPGAGRVDASANIVVDTSAARDLEDVAPVTGTSGAGTGGNNPCWKTLISSTVKFTVT
jgi:hypothetical protein